MITNGGLGAVAPNKRNNQQQIRGNLLISQANYNAKLFKVRIHVRNRNSHSIEMTHLGKKINFGIQRGDIVFWIVEYLDYVNV